MNNFKNTKIILIIISIILIIGSVVAIGVYFGRSINKNPRTNKVIKKEEVLNFVNDYLSKTRWDWENEQNNEQMIIFKATMDSSRFSVLGSWIVKLTPTVFQLGDYPPILTLKLDWKTKDNENITDINKQIIMVNSYSVCVPIKKSYVKNIVIGYLWDKNWIHDNDKTKVTFSVEQVTGSLGKWVIKLDIMPSTTLRTNTIDITLNWWGIPYNPNEDIKSELKNKSYKPYTQ